MTREIFYKQCRLERREGHVRMERTTWLPEAFAVEGGTVRLRDGDTWTDGWTVVSASGTRLPERVAVNQAHAHTRQRRASDI